MNLLDSALLRRHPLPLQRKLEEFEDLCEELGLLDPSMDLTNARHFSQSMDKVKSIPF